MALLTTAACSADEVFPVVHHERIAVRVLEGKNGAPQARVHVVMVAGYNRRDLDVGMWREEAVTDEAGRVLLSDALRNLPLLRVEVLKRSSCATNSGDAAISVERIRRDGLSAANRCGTVVAVDAPGVLAVFVKGKKAGAKTTIGSGLCAEVFPCAVPARAVSCRHPPREDRSSLPHRRFDPPGARRFAEIGTRFP